MGGAFGSSPVHFHAGHGRATCWYCTSSDGTPLCGASSANACDMANGIAASTSAPAMSLPDVLCANSLLKSGLSAAARFCLSRKPLDWYQVFPAGAGYSGPMSSGPGRGEWNIRSLAHAVPALWAKRPRPGRRRRGQGRSPAARPHRSRATARARGVVGAGPGDPSCSRARLHRRRSRRRHRL